jgi:sporulation-control protein spo0M
MEKETGTSFPYSTSYRVSLPDGEPVTIGNSKIIVMVMGDSVDTSVDGNKEELAVGQERVISPHFARISALGVPLIDTDFQITLKYLGASGNNALFDMTVKTSQQVPELVLRRLIPANMNAQPV